MLTEPRLTMKKSFSRGVFDVRLMVVVIQNSRLLFVSPSNLIVSDTKRIFNVISLKRSSFSFSFFGFFWGFFFSAAALNFTCDFSTKGHHHADHWCENHIFVLDN